MAAITKRDNGTYKITVSMGRDPETNRQIRKYVTFTPTKKSMSAIEKEVGAFALEFEKKCLNGSYVDDKIRFDDLITKWKEVALASGKRTATVEYYEDVLNRSYKPLFRGRYIGTISVQELQDLANSFRDQGYSKQTIKKYIVPAVSLFDYAVSAQMLETNPMRKIVRPEPLEKETNLDEDETEKIPCFTIDQATKFLEIFDIKCNADISETSVTKNNIPMIWKAFFNLACYSGLRRGELISLTWKDVDLKANTVKVTKGTALTKEGQVIGNPKSKTSKRTVDIGPDCAAVLKEWRLYQMEHYALSNPSWTGYYGANYDNNFIFCQKDGSQMCIHSPRKRMKKIIDDYNANRKDGEEKLPSISLHGLRHSWASIQIHLGADILDVSKALGHSKPSITMDIYTHEIEDHNKEMAAAMTAALKRKA